MPGWALARPLKENILAKITIRDNGPYLIEGDDVSVTDASSPWQKCVLSMRPPG